jgi:hypothetical protein
MQRSCAYPAIFESPPQASTLGPKLGQVPNPYVMEPPPLGMTHLPAGQTLQWHQVLVGAPTVQQLPLIVHAWERSLRGGWGPARVRGKLLDLAVVDAAGVASSVRDSLRGALRPHEAHLPWPPLDRPARVAHLDIHTPLRLQHDGRPLRPGDLSPRKLAADLMRRISLMMTFHLRLGPLPFDAQAIVAHAVSLTDDRSALHWRDDARYSSRQRQETPLGGVLGRWTLRGNLDPLLPWLTLGQWLHIGKNATMGLGGYTVRAVTP